MVKEVRFPSDHPIRLYSGFGLPEDSNARYKFFFDHGLTGIGIALDLPTQLGYDSDHPRAKGEVGRMGVHIDSLKDMELLFDGIPLDKIGWVGTVGHAIGPIILSWFIALGKRMGIPPTSYMVRIAQNPFTEYAGRGAYILPMEPAIRLTLDSAEYCLRNFPNWHPLLLASSVVRSQGVTSGFEIGFLLSEWYEYAKALLKRGLTPDQFVKKIEFDICLNTNFVEEVAKLRALTICWRRLLSEKMGVKDPGSLRVPGFAAAYPTATFTKQEPVNNMVRLTMFRLASVLGGWQECNVFAPDEVLGIPSQESQLLSLRIQQIIAYESGIDWSIDPLGGSSYFDDITSKIAEEGWECLNQIEAAGGILRGLQTGRIQMQAAKYDYQRQKDIDNGKRVIVGLNKFPLSPNEKALSLERFKGNPDAERIQVDRVKQLRRERDNTAVNKALAEVQEALRTNINIVPFILKAVEAYATVGEICAIWRAAFGEYREPSFKL